MITKITSALIAGNALSFSIIGIYFGKQAVFAIVFDEDVGESFGHFIVLADIFNGLGSVAQIYGIRTKRTLYEIVRMRRLECVDKG